MSQIGERTLVAYSVLRMTVDYLEKDKWDEAAIDARAADFANRALIIWKGIEL